MKTQIQRLSPHQNGKVFAVLLALTSLVLIVPFMLIALIAAPAGTGGMQLIMVVLFPLFYLVIGYVMAAVGCWLYNLMFKYIGGFEFESRSDA